ncbi:gamma-aminobutyraldehyde dehydrogenase [Neisseria sp. ZJ106]|uniref:Gamma-aminobutyraldehyde dehydrogenase n=1 Tax=Neisseria lisongii TaxID=2912188 RepID=A0ABY7RHJ3_9NEIS|nr:gamma-aminobutyraldehyde dehydrogenase [Neisseria lisongii]MCF7520779.1 gamma-aminobutyraldehyde dehydrogenase [Neisseria lisongii]WCL70717.1 gamma-aminobutyraldehyde dehydrogenase [Neisseria lisongii]
MQKLKHFINGEYVEPKGSEYFDLISPVTGEAYAQSPIGTDADVEAAYAAAATAFQEWKRSTPSMRQKALLALADAIEANGDKLVEVQSRETGQIKSLIASEEVATSADQIRFLAGAARCLEGKSTGEYLAGTTSSIRREPLGVVGQVTPWNYPLMMAVWKIAPALAAGNTVILKPSDTTPQSTLLLAELAAPLFPKGAINVLLGKADTGSKIVSLPGVAMVSITGSVRAGIQVAKTASEHLARPHLELGGKAPVVVFADANLERAAEHIAITGFFNAGQDCTAASRVLVEASVYDKFVELMVEQAKNTKFGSPDDEDALYGALNNQNQLERVSGFFDRLPSYAKVETGGKRADRPGFYFEPTIITGLKQEDEAIQTEVFGPVITIQKFENDDEALAMANGVDYGLASSVWTADHSRAQRFSRELDFGTVWINTHIPLTGEMPHGGFKMSGYGKDLSLYALEEYTRIKHVMSNHEL